jgi:hypothetical protein
MPAQKYKHYLILVTIIGMLVTACNPQPTPVPVSSPAPGETLTVPLETTVVTTQPSPTPQPRSIYLIASSETEQNTLQTYQDYLRQQAAADGFLFETHESYPQDGINTDAKIVVFLMPPDDVDSLAAANPETQFIVITNREINAASNVSLIQMSPTQQAFLAGFIAVLVAPDYRAGGLIADSAPEIEQIQDGYFNGARYLCGRCTPVYGPIVAFPQVAIVPGTSPAEGWQAAFDQLNLTRIQTLFISPEAADPQFLAYLSSLNIAVLGILPPPDGFSNNWIATIQFDKLSSLDELWPDLLSGRGGQVIQAELLVSDINERWLTPGKMIMVEQVKDDLQAGWISPHSVGE